MRAAIVLSCGALAVGLTLGQLKLAADGSYLPRQCHDNQCWCVNPMTGQENDMTGENCDKKKAPATGAAAERAAGQLKLAADGSYLPRQCQDNQCWCVNPMTGQANDMTGENCDKKKAPKTGAAATSQPPKSPKKELEGCAAKREAAKKANRPGGYVPQCADDGKSYLPRQCHGKRCWCVDTVRGLENLQPLAKCGEKKELEGCAAKREAAKKANRPGGYVPQCAEDGKSYLPRQCHGKRCWCVDTVRGLENLQPLAKCGEKKELEGCAAKREAAKKANRPGGYVPQCAEDGKSYLSRQCHGKRCWCVDTVRGLGNLQPLARCSPK